MFFFFFCNKRAKQIIFCNPFFFFLNTNYTIKQDGQLMDIIKFERHIKLNVICIEVVGDSFKNSSKIPQGERIKRKEQWEGAGQNPEGYPRIDLLQMRHTV